MVPRAALRNVPSLYRAGHVTGLPQCEATDRRALCLAGSQQAVAESDSCSLHNAESRPILANILWKNAPNNGSETPVEGYIALSRPATQSGIQHGSPLKVRKPIASSMNLSYTHPRGLSTFVRSMPHLRKARMFHAGRGRKIEVEAAPKPSLGSFPIPPGNSKRSKTREELLAWQKMYEGERADLLALSFPAQENSSDFIRERQSQLLWPPRYTPGGELPKNFMGEEKVVNKDGIPIAQVGDVCVYLDKGIPACAVIVRRWNDLFNIYYDLDGNTILWKVDNSISLQFPNLIDPKEILPILPYLPPAPEEIRAATVEAPRIPGDAGIDLRRHLAKIRDDIQDSLNAHFEQFGSIWDLFAHESEMRLMVLEDMAVEVFKRPRKELTVAQIGALFCYLFQAPGPFMHERNDFAQFHPTNFYALVQILSRQDRELIRQVNGWYDEYRSAKTKQQISSSVIGRFIQTARALIQDSRIHRRPIKSGSLGPYGRSPVDGMLPELQNHQSIPIHTNRAPTLWPIDTPEATLLKYLKRVDKLKFKRWPGFDEPEQNVIPAIIRATNMYGDVAFTEFVFRLFLRELGLLAPWADTANYTGPCWEDPYDDHDLNKSVDRAAQEFEDRPDSLHHIRKDWGDLEVFCIDGPGTELIDDGMSVEPISEDPESFWIHVHVANPTAFMDINDPIAMAARKRVTSVYDIGYYRAMLPDAVSQRCSLKSDRAALTFSAKVRKDGEILEKIIRPGYIRNVIQVTPSTVHGIVGSAASKNRPVTEFVVGDRSILNQFKEKEMRAADNINPSQAKQLAQLHKLATALAAKWNEHDVDAVSPRYGNYSLHVTGIDDLKVTEDRPYRSSTDPTIIYRPAPSRVKHGSEYVSMDESDIMVQTIMQLASMIAGEYCAERNIPVMFYNMTPDPAIPDASRYYREFFQSIPTDRPFLRDLSIRAVMKRRGQVFPGLSSAPVLGLSPRVSSTSPLRRFVDMLAHFQIHHSLQLEANGFGSKIRFEENDSRLPFSFDQIKAMVPSVARNIQFWKARSSATRRPWFHELVNRALRFGEDPSFPRYLEVIIHVNSREGARVFSPQLCRVFNLYNFAGNAPTEGYIVGEWWLAEFALNPANSSEDLYAVARLGREYPDGFKYMEDMPSDLPKYSSSLTE